MKRARFASSLFLVVLVLGGTTANAQQPSAEPVATVKQIMSVMIAPASNAVIAAASRPPANETEWGRLGNQALMLAESGNLLMVGSRVRDREDWLRMSRDLREAAAVVLQAANTRNASALAQARGRLDQACGQCHTKYVSRATLKVRAPGR